MMSILHEGKVLDFKFKTLQPNQYAFYCGELYIGQVFKLKSGWSAVGSESYVPSIDGFKTRWKACEYLLKALHYNRDYEVDVDPIEARMRKTVLGQISILTHYIKSRQVTPEDDSKDSQIDLLHHVGSVINEALNNWHY